MKKIIFIAFILIFSVVWIRLPGFEFGKYDSFKEAMDKGVAYEVKEILHTQRMDGITVVMYTKEPSKIDFSSANYDALAVAFLKGSDQDGWENIGPNGWEHAGNENMTSYIQSLHQFDDQGEIKQELNIVYGEINNPDIAKIETKIHGGKNFKEADIILANGQRYYLQAERAGTVRGIANDGKIIDQQGG